MGEVSDIRSQPRSDTVRIQGRCRAIGTKVNAVCYGICSYDSNSMKSSNPNSGIYVANTARTLDANGGNPACNQGGVCIVEILDT